MFMGLAGFTEMKMHLLDAGDGAGENYQMRFTVHYGAGTDSGEHMYCGGKCKTDFSDLRFTAQDKITLYTYYLESKVDEDYAVFWVKITESLDSNRIMYVYYGNPDTESLSSTSAFDAVIPNVALALPLEEAEVGDAIDYSGNGNDGVATGTTVGTAAPKWVGKPYRVINGLGDQIVVADDATIRMVGGTTKALSFWANFSSLSAGNDKIIIGHTGATNYYLLYMNAGSMWFTVTRGAASNVDAVCLSAAQITPLLNAWHLYTLNVTASKIQFWVDGTKVKESDIGAGTWGDVATVFKICHTTDSFVGSVAPVCLYAALSDAQITALAAAFPDPSLLEGSICIRKYASTTLPLHSTWGEPIGLPFYCTRHARRRRQRRDNKIIF
jgi:hypothetical protein